MIRGSVWHQEMEWWNIKHKENGAEFKAFFPDLRTNLTDIMADGVSDALVYNRDAWEEAGVLAEMNAEMLDVATDLVKMTDVFLNADDETQWVTPGVEVAAHEELLYVENFQDTSHDFIGYADAVLRVPGVYGVVGVDYKATGKAWGGAKGSGDPRKLVQPPLYAEAWEQMHSEPMDWFVMDVMTKAGKFQRVWVPTGWEVREPFLGRWTDVVQDIDSHRDQGHNHPTNPSHFLCSVDYCDYWDFCPMGQPLTDNMALQIGGNHP